MLRLFRWRRPAASHIVRLLWCPAAQPATSKRSVQETHRHWGEILAPAGGIHPRTGKNRGWRMTATAFAVWQISGGPGSRTYAEIFLRHGVALIGPGDAGPWNSERDDDEFDGGFVRRF